MIELCEAEINAVSGGYEGSTPVKSYPGSEAPSIIAQLSAQKPWDPYTHLRAYQLKAYREANPDSPTWYADFFGL
jgi:hypothetical protein